MARRAIIPCLLFLSLSCVPAFAQGPASPGAPAQGAEDQATAAPATKVDPAKAADIRKLLEMTGAANMGTQVVDNMQKNLRQVMINSLPPGDYREKLVDAFWDKFRSLADTKLLTDMTVQIYDKYLSDDEIKGLIQFYSTPLGQKMAMVLPKIAGETQEAASKWGEDLGQLAMVGVLADHPDLAQAMEDAGKQPQPRQPPQ